MKNPRQKTYESKKRKNLFFLKIMFCVGVVVVNDLSPGLKRVAKLGRLDMCKNRLETQHVDGYAFMVKKN